MALKRLIPVKSAAAVLLTAAVSWAAFLYPSSMPKVAAPDVPYDTVLKKTWDGIKKRNVIKYTTGMVHRPKSNIPGDAVSEGISYGMFLALYCNDPAYFNSIWDAGERYMWNNGGFYDWRVNESGQKIGTNPASDADQDIALLLIFADRLAKNNVPGWTSFTSVKGATYASRARDLLNTIRGSMIANNGALMPGKWGDGGDGIINPGYFAPAFYRVFAEFDSTNRSAWNSLIDGCYAMIEKSPGYKRGLVPDWFNFEGGSTGGAGYNAYFAGDALYRDAIRVYWRLGIDYLWYGEPRAKVFLDSAFAFITKKGGAKEANFFDMEGNLLPAEDTEKLGNPDSPIVVRKRREHSHLTVGMWAIAAMASGGAGPAKSYSDELLKFYEGSDYWGNAVDPAGGIEDTMHNEMYFDQFLAWFGASALGGVFTNVWQDLKDGVPQGPPMWEARPAVTPITRVVDASAEPLRVTASFNRTVRWTVTIKHDTSGIEASFSGDSKNVSAAWYGLSQTGNNYYMPQGLYTLTVSGAGIDEIYTAKVWLARPASNSASLIVGKRLLVDDFADGDLIPYIGKEWKNYLDAQDHAGSSTGVFSMSKGGGDTTWLNWSYALSGGDPYAALEWNCGQNSSPLNMKGIDTIIVVAKSGGGNVNVSVQLISSDFNFSIGEYHYFEDSLRLTAAKGEYRLPISRFKQRMNGSGKELGKTLETMTGIRFHIQSGNNSAGTVMVSRMYFAGDSVSKLYTPPPAPPAYAGLPPDVSLDPPIGVAYRSASRPKYTIKRSANSVMITLPPNMAGAQAALIDIRGRTLMRLEAQKDGRLTVPLKSVARGAYFVNIKGRGQELKVKVLKAK